jgi:hypothetical protein
MNSDIKKMPVPLMFIAIIGLTAPILMILPIWGKFNNGEADNITLLDFLIVCICALIVFLSSLGIFLRKPCARWSYLFGWGMTCLSPLLWARLPDDLGLIIPPIVFDLLIGLGLFFYFIRSSEVRAYLTVT